MCCSSRLLLHWDSRLSCSFWLWKKRRMSSTLWKSTVCESETIGFPLCFSSFYSFQSLRDFSSGSESWSWMTRFFNECLSQISLLSWSAGTSIKFYSRCLCPGFWIHLEPPAQSDSWFQCQSTSLPPQSIWTYMPIPLKCPSTTSSFPSLCSVGSWYT